MKALILIGIKRDSGKPVCLYTGLSGVELQQVAAKAAASGEFREIGKLMNPSVVPMPIVGHVTKRSTPEFPREKAKKQPKAASANSPLDKMQEASRKMREERYKTSIELENGKVVDAKAKAEAEAKAKQNEQKEETKNENK
jgi:hypothetical protein